MIAFTSGTTRNPKGVVHSHHTLGFETRQLAATYPLDIGAQIIAAPVGHFIGMLSALLNPVLRGLPINLLDAWNPGRVLALIIDGGLAVGGGVPYYLTSLLEHPDFTEDHLRHLKYAPLGGAAVPVAVADRLAGLGITVYRAYGSTEHPSITSSLSTAPESKRLYTDGAPLPGTEIELAEDGEILSRGPDLFLGYTDAALTESVFDDEGWYHTGDVGVLDDDGYLTITDRKADFIIRGGENITLRVRRCGPRLAILRRSGRTSRCRPRTIERRAASSGIPPGSPDDRKASGGTSRRCGRRRSSRGT